MKCGLLGGKLGHSYSPMIHKELGNYAYNLYEKSQDEIESFLQQGDFIGLNVTIPYKKNVIAYCHRLSDTARSLGSVNTIVRNRDGSLIGHNTDYFGFTYMLKKSGLAVQDKKVLVLGSGGASVTVVAVLKALGAKVNVISRSGEDNYSNLSRHDDTALIVNTTPLGMYPNVGISPIALTLFPKLEGVLDLVYNPARTQLLLDAERLGLIAVNGLWMLVAQAKESAEWFTGRKIDDSIIDHIYSKIRRNTENIILIGMPGCGKSTVGTLLADKSGKRFVDADAEIEKYTGMPIPQIFAQYGEPYFRDVEAEVLKQLGKGSNQVIATGGGCVLRKENYAALHQNGSIIWLQRDLERLPTEGRPLSQSNRLEDLFAVRQPLYREFADHIIDNNRTTVEPVNEILALEVSL